MPTIKSLLSVAFSLFVFVSYGQKDDVIDIDSTRIRLIGNKLYKAHQGFHRINGSLINTTIQYTEIDLSNILFKTSTSELLQNHTMPLMLF